IAGDPRIVKYVDVPLQHMSSPVLRRMRRGISGDRQVALLDHVRERIPDVAIRTTLITGFPGETDADHARNVETVEGGAFDRLGVFAYSPEEGTPAHDLPDAVPPELAEERRAELMAAQQRIHFGRNAARIGQRVDVLVEVVDRGARTARGRTPHDAPDVDAGVRIEEAGEDVEVGRVRSVRITGTDAYDLVGVP
ncbi:MAG: radical SAM protein, partial [Planctomycetota bacterium]